VVHELAARLSLLTIACRGVQGACCDTSFSDGVKTALTAGVIAYGVGLVLGEIIRRVIDEQVTREFAEMQSTTA
jgi:hypothetical protein